MSPPALLKHSWFNSSIRVGEFFPGNCKQNHAKRQTGKKSGEKKEKLVNIREANWVSQWKRRMKQLLVPIFFKVKNEPSSSSQAQLV